MSQFLKKPIAIVVLVAFVGCARQDATEYHANAELPRDGHERMISLLREIRDRHPDPTLFVGDARLLEMQKTLATLPTEAPQAARAAVHGQLGYEMLYHGRVKESIEHLQSAYETLRDPNVQTDPRNREYVIYGLGLAHLRLGENENCVNCNNGASCLLPISPKGIHNLKTGSEGAVKYLEILLKENPDRLDARWLLNIAYMTLGKYPQDVPKAYLIPPDRYASEEPFPRFPNIAGQLGLDTMNLAGGCIVDDFDGDGFLDIVVSNMNKSGQLRYFHNQGDGSFVDATDAAGLTGIFGGLNIVHADYDNDGDLDILVLRGAWMREQGRLPKSLLQNDGHGQFRDVTFEAGLGAVHYPTQTAAWADYDGDGDLDLYVGNENDPSQLFQNQGDGTFIDVAPQAGVVNGEFTKGVVWGDYDGDGRPDLYASNLGAANCLYHNEGGGRFRNVAQELSVERPIASFAAWFWDYNNDGALDLMVWSYDTTTNKLAAAYLGQPYGGEPDCLYQGDGKGHFRDVTAEQKLVRATSPMGCNFGDLDNDGFPDIYLGTGYQAFDALMPNLLYHNRRGQGFADVTTAAGMGHLQKGHGVSFADLDQDGDQDVMIELGGAYLGDGFRNALFENPGFGNNWIVIKLVGTRSNRCAIGARIRADIVDAGAKRTVYAWVTSGSSFGGNPLRQHLGLGKAARIERLQIFWPTTGQTQELKNLDVKQFIEITEGKDGFRTLPYKRTPFRDRGKPANPTTAALTSG